MSKRIECKRWKRKLTPSGYGDNGMWELTDEIVSFPSQILESSIVAEITLKADYFSQHPSKAYKVTHGNKSWVVDRNPLDIH